MTLSSVKRGHPLIGFLLDTNQQSWPWKNYYKPSDFTGHGIPIAPVGSDLKSRASSTLKFKIRKSLNKESQR